MDGCCSFLHGKVAGQSLRNKGKGFRKPEPTLEANTEIAFLFICHLGVVSQPWELTRDKNCTCLHSRGNYRPPQPCSSYQIYAGLSDEEGVKARFGTKHIWRAEAILRRSSFSLCAGSCVWETKNLSLTGKAESQAGWFEIFSSSTESVILLSLGFWGAGY